MLAPHLIERGGSKLEITRALLEEGNYPIPASAWKYYGDDHAPLLLAFKQMQKPVIVRGSHRHDYHGFIDVIPTVLNVTTSAELEQAIARIERVSASDDVRIHAQEWGLEHTPAVHILLQEQSSSPIISSMLRHPHTGKLYMQFYNRNLRESDRLEDRFQGNVAHATMDKRFGLHNFSSNLGIQDDEIAELIAMYERIEQSSAVDGTYAHHVEFGLQPLLFYQTRAFKPFSPPQEFFIPVGNVFEKQGIPRIWSVDAFGITPPEGIELTYALSDVVDFQHDRRFTIESPYGVLQLAKANGSYPTAKRTKGLTSYVSVADAHNYLFHGSYRLMKLAQYSMVAPSFVHVGSNRWGVDRADVEEFRRSRFFSNGEQAVLIPSKYL